MAGIIKGVEIMSNLFKELGEILNPEDKIKAEFKKYKNKRVTVIDRDIFDKLSIQLNIDNIGYSRSELESFIACYQSRDEELQKWRDRNDKQEAKIIDQGEEIKKFKSIAEEYEHTYTQIESINKKYRDALKKAKQFIENGIEYGFIRMPDLGDTALDTLPMIIEALKDGE